MQRMLQSVTRRLHKNKRNAKWSAVTFAHHQECRRKTLFCSSFSKLYQDSHNARLEISLEGVTEFNVVVRIERLTSATLVHHRDFN